MTRYVKFEDGSVQSDVRRGRPDYRVADTGERPTNKWLREKRNIYPVERENCDCSNPYESKKYLDKSEWYLDSERNIVVEPVEIVQNEYNEQLFTFSGGQICRVRDLHMYGGFRISTNKLSKYGDYDYVTIDTSNIRTLLVQKESSSTNYTVLSRDSEFSFGTNEMSLDLAEDDVNTIIDVYSEHISECINTTKTIHNELRDATTTDELQTIVENASSRFPDRSLYSNRNELASGYEGWWDDVVKFDPEILLTH